MYLSLNPNTKWCQLMAIISWSEAERKYAKIFKSQKGQAAYSVRLVLGALLIQNRKFVLDQDTVEEITESPYMQLFIGLRYLRRDFKVLKKLTRKSSLTQFLIMNLERRLRILLFKFFRVYFGWLDLDFNKIYSLFSKP